MTKCKECGNEIPEEKVNNDLFRYCPFCLHKKLNGFLLINKGDKD